MFLILTSSKEKKKGPIKACLTFNLALKGAKDNRRQKLREAHIHRTLNKEPLIKFYQDIAYFFNQVRLFFNSTRNILK